MFEYTLMFLHAGLILNIHKAEKTQRKDGYYYMVPPYYCKRWQLLQVKGELHPEVSFEEGCDGDWETKTRQDKSVTTWTAHDSTYVPSSSQGTSLWQLKTQKGRDQARPSEWEVVLHSVYSLWQEIIQFLFNQSRIKANQTCGAELSV